MTDTEEARRLVIAIDGPSGSGKSTVSRRVATALGLRYLDTGSIYRAVTWRILGLGVEPADPIAVAAAVAAMRLEVGTDPAAPTISVDGTRLQSEIRGPAVTAHVSAVSAIRAVREQLLHLQRDLIGSGGIVVEGRDIGSVVAPDAAVKVFLTASDDARARRRSDETSADIEGTRADLDRRDRLDSTRAAAPLHRAPDALEIDSTALGIDEVVERVLAACARLTHSRPSGSAAQSPPLTGSPTL